MLWIVASILVVSSLPPKEIGAGAHTTGADAERARNLFAAGNRAYEKRAYDRAALLFRASLEAYPRPSTAYNLANSYAASGRNAEALRVLEDLKAEEYGVLSPERLVEVEEFRAQIQLLLPRAMASPDQRKRRSLATQDVSQPLASVSSRSKPWRPYAQIGVAALSEPQAQPQLSLGLKWMAHERLWVALAATGTGVIQSAAASTALGVRLRLASPLWQSQDFGVFGSVGLQVLHRSFELNDDAARSGSFLEESFFAGGRVVHQDTGLGFLIGAMMRPGRAQVSLDGEVQLSWPRWDVLTALEWEVL